jgi:hypothetical protein
MTLKNTYFHDTSVEIKSNWLRIPQEQQAHYLSPYNITPDELKEFTNKLYDALLSYDITLIAAVVDKPEMQKRYVSPQSPSSLAYRLLFERIEMFLVNHTHGDYGVVIFDKITELELRRKGYEDLLYKQHLRYLEKGTDFMSINQIVEGLLFIGSHENNMLQLVDLCGYNIFRQFVNYGNEWEELQAFTNRYSYFELIESKLDRTPTGIYAGLGIKKFP